jgi:hypothetical protein
MNLAFMKHWLSELKSKFDTTPTLPKRINEQEDIVVSIVEKLLPMKDTELYLDPKTQECYLSNGKYNVFLESTRVRVINSVFGYDVYISAEVEVYLVHIFMLEVSKRRSEFKENIISKVNKNLNSILIDLDKM